MSRTLKIVHVFCVIIMSIMTLAVILPLTVYAAENPLKFMVNQSFATSSLSIDGVFSYKLRAIDAGNPMPAGSTAEGYAFTVTGNNTFEIGLLSYNTPGVYRYELSQVIAVEKSGYTYDKRIYKIDVYIDGWLGAEVIVRNENGKKAADIKFENSYQARPSDPVLMVDPPVKKTVYGTPNKDTSFKFKLTARDASYPMPTGSINGVKTIQITGSSKSEFGVWSYNKEGVYYYTVSEENGGESGYTYDKTVYSITDTVRDDNGQLVLSRVVTNDTNSQVTSLDFINKYSDSGKPGPGPITGVFSNPELYITLFVLSSVLLIGLVIFSKRKKRFYS